jgi:hypothetical protein
MKKSEKPLPQHTSWMALIEVETSLVSGGHHKNVYNKIFKTP